MTVGDAKQYPLEPLRKRKFPYYQVFAIQDTTPLPWRNVWKSKVPLKAAFFSGQCHLGKILTTDTLKETSDHCDGVVL